MGPRAAAISRIFTAIRIVRGSSMRDGRSFPGMWTMDYPRSDRHLLEGVRRLTRIDTRSVEQVVDLDGTDDIYNWPVLYGVEVGHWLLPDDQATQLREFLLRGGFFMCDDFHGSEDFRGAQRMGNLHRQHDQGFSGPADRRHPRQRSRSFTPCTIWRTVFRSPARSFSRSEITYEKGPTGKVPHWRCIRDDKGRSWSPSATTWI